MKKWCFFFMYITSFLINFLNSQELNNSDDKNISNSSESLIISCNVKNCKDCNYKDLCSICNENYELTKEHRCERVNVFYNIPKDCFYEDCCPDGFYYHEIVKKMCVSCSTHHALCEKCINEKCLECSDYEIEVNGSKCIVNNQNYSSAIIAASVFLFIVILLGVIVIIKKNKDESLRIAIEDSLKNSKDSKDSKDSNDSKNNKENKNSKDSKNNDEMNSKNISEFSYSNSKYEKIDDVSYNEQLKIENFENK